MNIGKLIEIIPDSVKVDIADFADVRLKTGKMAVRVMLDRLLTEAEQAEISAIKRILWNDTCVAVYKYAPEIRKSYFYVV